MVSAVHGIAHIWNAFSFVNYYDHKHPDINWAKDENDVSTRASISLCKTVSNYKCLNFSECFPFDFPLAHWIHRKRDVWLVDCNVDLLYERDS